MVGTEISDAASTPLKFSRPGHDIIANRLVHSGTARLAGRREVADERCVDAAADLATLELPEDQIAWAIAPSFAHRLEAAAARTGSQSNSSSDAFTARYS